MLRVNCPYRGKDALTFGATERADLDVEDRYFVYALTERGRPQVFDFDCDEEGVEAVANLIRTEGVQAVIKGRRTEFELSSAVVLHAGKLEHEHRSLVLRG